MPESPRKQSASIILESSSVLLQSVLAPAYARCASVAENDYHSAQKAIPDSKCSCGCAVLQTTRPVLCPGANCIDTMKSETGMTQLLSQAHNPGLEPHIRARFSKS